MTPRGTLHLEVQFKVGNLLGLRSHQQVPFAKAIENTRFSIYCHQLLEVTVERVPILGHVDTFDLREEYPYTTVRPG